MRITSDKEQITLISMGSTAKVREQIVLISTGSCTEDGEQVILMVINKDLEQIPINKDGEQLLTTMCDTVITTDRRMGKEIIDMGFFCRSFRTVSMCVHLYMNILNIVQFQRI